MKTIITSNAIISIAESKAVCPFCDRKIPFDELEEKWIKSKNNNNGCFIRVKDKCQKFIGIAVDMKGDFLAFKL